MAKGGEDTAKINEKSDAIALLERLANAPAELPPTPPARASQRDGTEPRAPLFATFTAVSSSDLLAGCQGDAERARTARVLLGDPHAVRATGSSTGSGTRITGLRLANGTTPSPGRRAREYT